MGLPPAGGNPENNHARALFHWRLLDNLPDGVILVDEDGTILFWSSAAGRLTGVNRDAVTGLKLKQVALAEVFGGTFSALFDEAKKAGKALQVIHDFSNMGAGRALEISARRCDETPEKGVLIIIRDETDKRLVQAKMMETQRLEALGRLAGGVAHDYNNCLTGILGYASLLKESLADNPEWTEYASAIERSARHAADVTAKLLAFAGRRSGAREPVVVNFVIQESLALASETFSKNISVRLDLSRELPPVTASPGQLEQAMVNVILAARDAMPQGGVLTVKSMCVADAPIGRGGERMRGVAVSISNTGRGFETGDKARVFEPFFAAAGRGETTGLGLAAAYGIARAHGGTIDVESRTPGGTTFTLYLPAIEVAGEGTRESRREGEAPEEGGGATVLVVEDEEIVRKLAVDVLSLHGYRVEAAASGEEAPRVAERMGGEIAAALLDVQMPGMSGKEVFDWMQKRLPDVSMVVCTGYGADEEAAAMLESPKATLLAKPFSSSQLLAAISAAVAQGRAGTKGRRKRGK